MTEQRDPCPALRRLADGHSISRSDVQRLRRAGLAETGGGGFGIRLTRAGTRHLSESEARR